MALPRSAMLVLWLEAVLRGRTPPDDFAVAVRGDDPQHLVSGWPDSSEPFPLDLLPAAVRRSGATAVTSAFPVPGDPLGLAGPAAFNLAVLEAEEAVLVSGPGGTLGLVPGLDARTVVWSVQHAARPPYLDPADEGRRLRQVLLEATGELVRLEVASWAPEIPDLLLNLRHREPSDLPADTAASVVETIERAVLCREIVALARIDQGGALTSHEIEARSRCLTDLDVAARRALAACCSASLGPS